MHIASQQGLPVMRPLFVDFPTDPNCQAVEDQFLFGPEILVAPILTADQRERSLYLPAGVDWQDAWSGEPRAGGQWVRVPAPLERIPVFIRAGSGLETLFAAE